jgi:hypothetical protein
MASTRRREVAVLACAGLTFFLSGSASTAQDPPGPARASDASPSRPEWGTQDRILTHVGFNEFAPTDPGTTFGTLAPDGRYGLFAANGGSGSVTFAAIAHVPSGAFLNYLELDYCDDDDAAEVSLDLNICDYLGSNCTRVASIRSGIFEKNGCTFAVGDLNTVTFDHTVDNNVHELVLEALTGRSSLTRLLGVYIGYKLQISPAPSAATFADVPPSHPYFRAVEALAASGITGGCGNGNFCPEKNVSRGEMAAFLARALGLHFPN